MDALQWIRDNLAIRQVSAPEMYYQGDSQSGRQLPLIYRPFEVDNPGHWADRGAALDFSMVAGPGRVLDFGPGDGWPSLIVAPFVEEVVGVDGVEIRVDTCTENAGLIGMENATFIYVKPGDPLPFEDESFDGVMASASIEEVPDPRATLQEMYRVLKPGGRLRFSHAAFVEYRDLPCFMLDLQSDGERASLGIWEVHLDEEWLRHTRLSLDLSRDHVVEAFRKQGLEPQENVLPPKLLQELHAHITHAEFCYRSRPSGATFLRWLREIGFSSADATYEGRWFAAQLFHQIPESERPSDYHGIDELLRPLMPIIVSMAKPVEPDGAITATK